MSREQIDVALYALLQGITTFTTTSRRLPPNWVETPAERQPALFLLHGQEMLEQNIQRMGGPLSSTIEYTVVLMIRSGGQINSTPMSRLNPVIDAVVNAVHLTNGEKQTLGGLVHRLIISGPIETDEGLLGDQAIAVLTLNVIASGAQLAAP
jgi:hypothetical protein